MSSITVGLIHRRRRGSVVWDALTDRRPAASSTGFENMTGESKSSPTQDKCSPRHADEVVMTLTQIRAELAEIIAAAGFDVSIITGEGGPSLPSKVRCAALAWMDLDTILNRFLPLSPREAALIELVFEFASFAMLFGVNDDLKRVKGLKRRYEETGKELSKRGARARVVAAVKGELAERNNRSMQQIYDAVAALDGITVTADTVKKYWGDHCRLIRGHGKR